MRVFSSRTALAAAITLALGIASANAAVIDSIAPTVSAIDVARDNPALLILRAGIFDPAIDQLDASRSGSALAGAASAYAIVQFNAGVDLTAARQSLVAQGVTFLAYVPNNAYYVRLGASGLKPLRADAAVRWAGTLQPALKLDPQLSLAERENSVALQAEGSYEIQIDAFEGVSSAAIAAELEKKVPGVSITMRSQRAEAAPYVRAAVSLASLDTLIRTATAIEGVALVSPFTPNTTANAASVGAIQGNSINTTCAGSGPICGPAPIWDHGITGTGQIAAVADSGTSPNAAWFATLDIGMGPVTAITASQNPAPTLPNVGTIYPNNKIIAYWLQPGGPVDYDFTSGHGTHVTGTVLGDAAGTFGATTYMPATPLLPNHDLADGMAPGAQLLFQDAGPTSATSIIIQDFDGTLEQAFKGGARVHNNSWGAKTGGGYNGNDASLDRTTRKWEDMLVVVAAGNDVAGLNATGSPGNAKNALTVAALGHAGSLIKAGYSNKGPTKDGRAKPDIAAPGSAIISARRESSFGNTVMAPLSTSNSGTSMASPTITGNAVLMRQFFADGFYPRGEKKAGDSYNISGMALKASLLNGTNTATDAAAWPSTGTGWGRAWLDGNLWFKDTMPGGDDSRRLRLFERTNAGGLVTGESHEYTITNVGQGVELRASLTWFDPDAAPAVVSTLINNLDLEVVAPGGVIYKGNVLTAGISQPGGLADSKDTVEQFRLTTPVAGSYTFRIKASSVPGNGNEGSDRQGYALAVSGLFGLPDPMAFPAPTNVLATSSGSAGVAVSFNAAPGAQGFQLYRANGSCRTVAAGDFRMVGHAAAAPIVDTTTTGGFEYAYKVRGVQGDVEGDVSDCIDVLSDGICTLSPSFDTQSLTGNGMASDCSVELSWSPAEARCPTSSGISYTIERDADPYFGTPETIATGVASPNFIDLDVSNGMPYFYRVVAQDSYANASAVSRTANVTPSGVDGPNPAAFLDDVDTHTYLTMQSPWQVTDTAASNGSFSYRSAKDDQPYPDATCATITTPALTLLPNSTLEFKARYNLEFQWDGVAQEISVDGGLTWTDLAPDGGYPSTFAQTMNPPINGCGFVASHGAFTGVTTATSNAAPDNDTLTAVFKPFSVNLAAYAGQTVQIRWLLSSDPASGYEGFLLDEVRIGDGSTPIDDSDVIFADGFEDVIAAPDYMCH